MDLPRLCFLSYRAIREFAAPVLAEFAGRADIEVVDGSFEQALAIAHDRLARGSVDAFVSAGANAALLRRHLQAPVATIALSGFDILQALIRARGASRVVGIVTFGQIIPELEAVKGLLKIGIEQHAYATPAEARARIAALKGLGVTVVVGSSLVVEAAAAAGLHGELAYSLDSIRQGFEHAMELARVARLEAGRTAQLDAVLQHLQDAVLAVDGQGRVIAANPAMQQALDLPATRLAGRTLAELPAELELQGVLDGAARQGVLDGATRQGVLDGAMRQGERGVLRLAGRDWVAARRPIVERGAVTGATLTLYDAGRIHEADSRLRSQQRRRQQATHRGARWRFDDLLGRDDAFLRTLATARRYARTELSILIRGESGTGKELLAQAIHQASARSARPFVAINCAALPESLLESELFGHEEGAFTGARRGGQRGLIEAAHTGTLFLDEIGDMPPALQTRLLRALQEREIQRLGASASIPVDVRVIAATHQPLEQLLREQRFRPDLFYRLDTLRLALPPLRDRAGDVALIGQALLAEALRRHGSRIAAAELWRPLAPVFEAYPWPGNVRELSNAMERLAVFARQGSRLAELPLAEFALECPEPFAHARTTAAGGGRPAEGLRPAERARQALAACDGQVSAAARLLGVSRSTLWRWLR